MMPSTVGIHASYKWVLLFRPIRSVPHYTHFFIANVHAKKPCYQCLAVVWNLEILLLPVLRTLLRYGYQKNK